MALSAALIKYPGEELQDAKSNEDSVHKRVDAVYIAIKKYESKIASWNRQRDYLRENKDEIIFALFNRKSRDISSYVDKQLSTFR